MVRFPLSELCGTVKYVPGNSKMLPLPSSPHIQRQHHKTSIQRTWYDTEWSHKRWKLVKKLSLEILTDLDLILYNLLLNIIFWRPFMCRIVIWGIATNATGKPRASDEDKDVILDMVYEEWNKTQRPFLPGNIFQNVHVHISCKAFITWSDFFLCNSSRYNSCG